MKHAHSVRGDRGRSWRGEEEGTGLSGVTRQARVKGLGRGDDTGVTVASVEKKTGGVRG